MPLRDHFRPPVSSTVSWEEIHAMWPARLVLQLRELLPQGYVAGPKVHMESSVEVDIAAVEHDDAPRLHSANATGNPPVLWSPPSPTIAVETVIADDDEFEVRIYDAERGRQLVAAIELVSPANKDRLEKRISFVSKCAALLKQGVAVSIVDVVTTRQFNLYEELLQFLGQHDPTLGDPSSPLYAVSCRWRAYNHKMILQTWSHVLTIGQPLPTIPLWLTGTVAIPLNLDVSYEQTCHDLWLS